MIPTDKQITFANAISKCLDIPLPESLDFEEYRKFISKFADRFYAQQQSLKTKHIDAAGVITIETNDTIFDVLDKLFYGGEKFINEESVTYYYGENSFIEIHNELGNTPAMLVLNESIKFAREDIEGEKK
jgi:hypothetical protein